MSTGQPIPLTIRRDGNTLIVHGSALDITLLRVVAQRSDRTALKRIQHVWGVDRDTAKYLLLAARKGREK